MLFRDYRLDAAFDEMFSADGEPRAHYAELYDALSRLTSSAFANKSTLAGACYLSEGITFAHDGREHTFPFDLLPRLVADHEWRTIEAGLVQRTRALDRFLADVYGPQRAIHDGVVPNWLVVSCGGYMREMAGVEPPHGRWIHFAGIDLIRDEQGHWRVLEDNVRTPSGLSYVVQNRAFMRRVFPEAFARHHVAQVDQGPLMLREALAAAAADGAADDP